jgi:hypothetical protein
MRLSNHVRRLGRWSASIAVLACGRAEIPRPDTPASGLIPLDTIESHGALASRREAQTAFDAARAALETSRYAAAEAALTEAATFFRTEARTAHTDAREPLERIAVELDALAKNVALGEVRTPTVLDRTFARAHAAEASLHLLRAHAAMVRRANVHAGEELLITVDHIERAAQDARLQADSSIQAAIAGTRSLAIEMVKGMEAVPDEATRVTDEIERAIECIAIATTRTSTSLGPDR